MRTNRVVRKSIKRLRSKNRRNKVNRKTKKRTQKKVKRTQKRKSLKGGSLFRRERVGVASGTDAEANSEEQTPPGEYLPTKAERKAERKAIKKRVKQEKKETKRDKKRDKKRKKKEEKLWKQEARDLADHRKKKKNEKGKEKKEKDELVFDNPINEDILNSGGSSDTGKTSPPGEYSPTRPETEETV